MARAVGEFLLNKAGDFVANQFAFGASKQSLTSSPVGYYLETIADLRPAFGRVGRGGWAEPFHQNRFECGRVTFGCFVT